MRDQIGALGDAIVHAVEEGVRELDSLEDTVELLLKEFDRVVGLESSAVIGAVDNVAADSVREFGDQLRFHLTKQRTALATFNIAFFGRTGAGKSTLLSAFGRLDGGYVSPGDSDWTTEVTEVEWNGCRLWDTPGINGWGRTRSRADLEESARRAVEVADMVMLCFDTQSQQASEFVKVAEWVREFGKPTVAVLNVRNLRWRHPAKVPSDAARRSLSQTVREHADNIRVELTNIGLPATPVVAVHNRRALFARATTPYRGPSVSNFVAEQEKFGVDYLARWSNFSALEDLVTASVLEGGSELRRRALREGVRGMLTAKFSELDREARGIEPRIEATERSIEELLAVLGYPGDGAQETFLGIDRGTVDVLRALESIRGNPFTSPPTGRLDRHLMHLLRSHLASPRADAVAKADKLIAGAFDKKAILGETDFNDAVYCVDAIQTAVDEVWSSKSEFLFRELSLSALDSAPDLSNAELESTTLNGAAGSVKSSVARTVQAAGLAAGAGAGFLTVPAVVNAWNPAGWAATAASVALGVASQAGKYAGDKVANLGEQEKAAVRSDSIRSSRRVVHSTFDRMEEDLRQQSRQSTWEFVEPQVRGLLLNAIALRNRQTALDRLVSELRKVALSLPASPSAETIMTSAQTRVLETRAVAQSADIERNSMTEAFGRGVWLGEDWIENSETEADVDEPLSHTIFETRTSSDQERFRQLMTRVWNPRSFDRITAVTAMVRTTPAYEGTDESPRVDRGDLRPKIVFIGDYSSGKSSLIKRILVESGHPIPDIMRVHGGPSTGALEEYHVGNVCLVDTPGFQSSNPDHSAIALQAVAGAALVVFVLQVNLLIGDTSLIESIVRGTSRYVSKGSRTLYVINRSDELGVDPATSPEDYLAARDRKESELVAALASRGISVDRSQVYSVAGDPFGKVGSRTDITASAYAQHRAWDGIDPLVSTVGEIETDQASVGAARAALDLSLSRLLERRVELETEAGHANAMLNADSGVMQAVENSDQDASLLASSLREDLRSIIDSYANIARAQVRSVGSHDFHRMTEVANSWWTDGALQSDIERFRMRSAQAIEEWFVEHSSQIEREIAAAEFVEREFAIEDRFDGPLVPEGDRAKLVAGAAKGGARFAKTLGKRDVIYRLGKGIGVKFKPWGAVKAAGRAAKFAPILAAVGVAADGYGAIKSEKAAHDRDTKRQEAEDFIAHVAEAFAEQVLNGIDGDGPISAVEDRLNALVEYKDAVSERMKQAAVHATDAQVSIGEIDRVLEAAVDACDEDRGAQ